MTCEKCGTAVKEGQAYCGNCGAPQRIAAPPASPSPSPAQRPPSGPTASGGRPIVVAALLLGLLAGAVVFVWRMRSHAAPEAAVQSIAQEQPAGPAASPAQAPEPSAPGPPDIDKKPIDKKPIAKPPAHRVPPKKPAAIVEPAPPIADAPPPEPAPVVRENPPAAPADNRRKAVQEDNAVTDPASSPPPAAPALPPAKPAIKYNGPLSGVATWTGKLEKGQILTITGGTPSMGLLSGAGLPGVPVHITVDQSNLGFSVMPNASNGYLTVALKSHAKHDRITINWSVTQ